jgi:hypothetical protein
MNNMGIVKKQKPRKSLDLQGFDTICFSARGESRIRTHGPVTVNSFQDCRIRPLCHLSNKTHSISQCGCKYKNLFSFYKNYFYKNNSNFNRGFLIVSFP